jgi:hypothetical protein
MAAGTGADPVLFRARQEVMAAARDRPVGDAWRAPPRSAGYLVVDVDRLACRGVA